MSADLAPRISPPIPEPARHALMAAAVHPSRVMRAVLIDEICDDLAAAGIIRKPTECRPELAGGKGAR